MSSSFVCLYCAKSKLSATEAARRHKVILALGACVRDHTGHHWSIRLKLRSKRQLLNWPGVNIRSSANQGVASTVWRVDAGYAPPRIRWQVVRTRGCKASCGSYFRLSWLLAFHPDMTFAVFSPGINCQESRDDRPEMPVQCLCQTHSARRGSVSGKLRLAVWYPVG